MNNSDDFSGTLYTAEVEHDGGYADVSVTVNHDGTETATVRFDKSFTLRVNEEALDDLIHVLSRALGELERRRIYMSEDSHDY